MATISDYVTCPEAAEILGVTPCRVRQLVSTGRLNAERMGVQLFFLRSNVKRFAKLERPAGRPVKKTR